MNLVQLRDETLEKENGGGASSAEFKELMAQGVKEHAGLAI